MMTGRIPDEVDFPALFLPNSTVRHGPDSVCGMLRTGCATSSGFSVRHAPDYAFSSLENVYTHMGTVCDLAEAVIEKWYLLYLKLQNEKSKVLQGLTRDEFLKKAGDLYDEKYSDWYQHYIKKGKSPPINLISRGDTLVEYLGNGSQARKKYRTHSQCIRQIRNVIVHDVRVARIVTKDGQFFIPKPKVISEYRSWQKVAAVLKDEARIARDFAEQYKQAKEDLDALEQVLNEIWEILIKDIESEFYSNTRSTLRDMYNIEFSSASPTILNVDPKSSNEPPLYPPPSGTYSGGTADYRNSDK
jgi:hypothetical protein